MAKSEDDDALEPSKRRGRAIRTLRARREGLEPGLRFNNWLVYSSANVVLIAALVGIGMAWLVIKRAAHRAMPRPVPVP
jgi:hypothetical protein